MRKFLYLTGLFILALILCACSGGEQAESADQWDCTVTCTEESTADAYVITYSEEKIVSNTGALTFQNRNDFPFVVHLESEGEEAFSGEIQAGGNLVFLKTDKKAAYTVGVHADVDEGTEIKLMVYDGERSEVY